MTITVPYITPSDRIEYLVRRKYPEASALATLVMPEGSPQRDQRMKMHELAQRYRAELAKKPQEEIIQLYEQAEKDHAEWEEQQRFFHQPYAKADFLHWSRATYWTLDEAVALSLGKAPEYVTWENVSKHVRVSPFAKEYARRRDLAERAKNWEQLYDPALPSFFLAWTKRSDIPVVPELIQQVEARGIVIGDWQDAYNKLKASYEADTSTLKGLANAKDQAYQSLLQKHENLQDGLSAAVRELQLQREAPKEKPLQTRERETLLKLITGLAMSWFGYDPSAAKSGEIAEIRDALDRLGISMSDDTIRAKLKEGAALIPQEALENMETKPKSVSPKPKSAKER